MSLFACLQKSRIPTLPVNRSCLMGMLIMRDHGEAHQTEIRRQMQELGQSGLVAIVRLRLSCQSKSCRESVLWQHQPPPAKVRDSCEPHQTLQQWCARSANQMCCRSAERKPAMAEFNSRAAFAPDICLLNTGSSPYKVQCNSKIVVYLNSHLPASPGCTEDCSKAARALQGSTSSYQLDSFFTMIWASPHIPFLALEAYQPTQPKNAGPGSETYRKHLKFDMKPWCMP